MRLSLRVALCVVLSLKSLSAADFYPKVREVILEAEAASVGLPPLPDKSDPRSWGARLLCQAGYLDDARKLGAGGIMLARAQTLYGDVEGARKSALAETIAERKTAALENIADILWRMGTPDIARPILEQARMSVSAIADPTHRKIWERNVAQMSSLLAEPPPDIISPEPKPRPRPAPTSVIPPFPVTTDGFRKRDNKTITEDAKTNAEFLTQLYALIVAGSREGLLRLTESAKSSFQRMLAWASLEGLFIQLGAPDQAERYARLIPDDGTDCTLAKVEALASAGAAWGRQKQRAQAARCFDDALHLAATVGKDLAFGRSAVVAKVAQAEFDAGLPEQVPETLDLALDLAKLTPPRPKPINRVYPKGYFDDHQTQDDAYRIIFESATKSGDSRSAKRAAEKWHETSGAAANSTIVIAWVEAGFPDEAVAYAHSLKDRIERVPALLNLAWRWLDVAGVPLF